MGRPDPCILFAQSFVHSQLDEYVDEVLFSEPVVITACELLEQNASPSSPNISLIGATSPPSFALEVFVHCEGESRFRRLCQPFLYSHSSSNVLEVEAVVTNHLVLRGCYRSLTLVLYGNTAEDCGQFNIEFDLDSSLANVVYSPSEGKLEDLPPALRPNKLTFEESIPSLRCLSFLFPAFDIAPEMKQFLQLSLKICQASIEEDTVCKLVGTVVSAVSSYVMNDNNSLPICWDNDKRSVSIDNKKDPQQVNHVLSQATNEIFELYKNLQLATGSSQSLENEIILGSEAELPTSEMLIDMFNESFPFLSKPSHVELSVLSQNKDMIVGLGIALLLCSSRESCFHFINGGGMEQIVNLLCDEIQKSTTITLMLLAIVEFATRHGIGCEGFLGWWPRVDENVPIGKSYGYCYLLKLLMGKQRHDIASLASYILHRLRLYEIASRYESAVLSVLTNSSADSEIKTDGFESLVAANYQLKQILKLLTLFGPVEDPSPMASARKLSILGQSESLQSYTTTINIIDASKCSFTKWDIDTNLLSLLKEKGFFLLSSALLSSPILRSANGSTADIFVDIVTSIESILLTLLFCRSGLSYLLAQPEATELMILSLQDVEDISKTECITLRQATIFLSKGFFCRPQEVGMIADLHLRVGTAIDRLLTTTHSDEILWVLWELCAISRSDSGRQALLALGHFPEVVSVLMDQLRAFKDIEPVAVNNAEVLTGTSPLSLAIFHSAAEIFEVMVTDSTASSLRSWIGHAVELHKALHSSSPGSNRKDAPTRLLEWIDAGVVYHRNGVIGLLRYAAVLASGGDAHLSSTNVLVSDSIDVENVVGDLTNSLDTQVVDSLLGKFVSDKYFDGITLRNTSIVQLTTSFRILAIISENSVVAAALFEEGALTVLYVVLVNCKFMLESLSNTYDYLVDEGAESNSTSDLLLERSHEQSLLDLMIPSLVFLINLLQKLQEAKEQYRNKKLLNALLKLHREVSPKLAASAADLSFPYPSSAISFGAVCHLLASALACWPIFGWTPGLFHCVLESVQATSLLALGPKDACSMFCLLGDLFPVEDIWLWKNEMPPLSALRTLSIGTILGPQLEEDINWYLQREHLKVLLIRLTPQLDWIAQNVLHFAFTALVVMQDMLRIFIIRIACRRIDYAVVLLRPIISWMDNHINETSLSDTDIFKVHRLLDFIASLLEHPDAKPLILKVGAVRILQQVLQRCCIASDEQLIIENGVPLKTAPFLGWCFPVFKSLAYILNSQTSVDYSPENDESICEDVSAEDSISVGRHLLKLCQVLPVGRELLACVLTFKELVSFPQGRNSIMSIYSQIRSSALEEQELDERGTDGHNLNDYDWRWSPPFFNCWKKLLRSLDTKDPASSFVVETVYALTLSALSLSMDGKNQEGVAMLKCLFGLQYDPDSAVVSSNETFKDVQQLIEKLEPRIDEEEGLSTSNRKTTLHQVKESVKLMLYLLESPSSSSDKLEGIVSSEDCHSTSDVVHSVIITSQLMSYQTIISMSEVSASSSLFWMLNRDGENTGSEFTLGGFAEKFAWECPDSSLDRQLMPPLPAKRKMTSAEGSGRRMRDNSGSEATGSNALHRGSSMPSVSSVPSRRDTFRQRKPNTSRPPSMHVDDYVARERNIDGVSSGSNIVSSSHHRGGSTSGRPPSIHVDEFMARQRERQNPMPVTVGDASQLMSPVLDNGNDPTKLDRSQQLKADLDDDLQEINIIFDAESESDDKVPFPQPDDSLQPASIIIGGSSPGSVVEETEGDTNEVTRISQLGTPPTSEDGGSRSDIPSRRSISGSDNIPLAHEVNISVEKIYPAAGIGKTLFREQSDESKHVSPFGGAKGYDTVPRTSPASFPSHSFNVGSASSSVQPLPPPTFYQRNSPQKAAESSVAVRSQAYSEQKLPINQPPLPPTPRPTVSTVRDVQPPLSSGYPFQAFDVNGINTIKGVHIQSESLSSTSNSPLVSTTTQPVLWNAVSSGSRLHHAETYTSARPMPPLPPFPPPYASPIPQSSATNSGSQTSLYNQTSNVGVQPPPPSAPISDTGFGIFPTPGTSLASFSNPPFTPSSMISRPSVSGSFFSSPSPQPSQNSAGLSQTIQSMQPRPPPPPPPPSLLPPLPHSHLHHGPLVQVSQSQSEQMMPLQHSAIQVQIQPLQIPQQLHIPQLQFYYQPQQQEPLLQPLQPLFEQAQQQTVHLQADNTTQQQQESGMTLQQYFASPESIQSLLSDRDKLCNLLEQHPKLMKMLQERLGQQ